LQVPTDWALLRIEDETRIACLLRLAEDADLLAMQIGEIRSTCEAQSRKMLERTRLHYLVFYETVARIFCKILKSAGLVKW
jgi:DNA-binding transcriptional regulator LsrR (DeoR family)